MLGALKVDGYPRDVRILPGVAQRDAGGPRRDARRGNPASRAGRRRGRLRRGLHARHAFEMGDAFERQGRGVFATYMTGELFAVLAQHSILKAALGGNPEVAPDDAAFLDAAASAVDRPAAVSNLMFQIRAGQLLGFAPPPRVRPGFPACSSGLNLPEHPPGSVAQAKSCLWRRAGWARCIAAHWRRAASPCALSMPNWRSGVDFGARRGQSGARKEEPGHAH